MSVDPRQVREAAIEYGESDVFKLGRREASAEKVECGFIQDIRAIKQTLIEKNVNKIVWDRRGDILPVAGGVRR